MDEDTKQTAFITFGIASILITAFTCLYLADRNAINKQREIDKAAISQGLCQYNDRGGQYPGYHWDRCSL